MLISTPVCLKLWLSFIFFTFYMDETLIRLKKFATLLPKYWLADTTGDCFETAWQTVGGKGADF
jgi:hypothetical protein